MRFSTRSAFHGQRPALRRRSLSSVTVLAIALAWPGSGYTQADGDARPFSEGVVPNVSAVVAIHPPADDLQCSQHGVHAGDPVYLGDAAGVDCTVVRRTGGPEGRFPRLHATDGATNEDWYAFGAAVYAPFDGVVEAVHINPVTNPPGARGNGPASYIAFRHPDGTRVLYGHIAAPVVRAGDHVVAGQVVARIGNNGFAWFPHLHIGAWKGREAVQILMDSRALGALQARQAR